MFRDVPRCSHVSRCSHVWRLFTRYLCKDLLLGQLSVVVNAAYAVKSTMRFTESYRIHCLSSRTFRSLSSLSGWPVYSNNIFIQNSNDFFSALYYESLGVQKHSGKNKRRRHRYSETNNWMVSFTCKQPNPTPHTPNTLRHSGDMYDWHSSTQLSFSCIFFTSQLPHRKCSI